MASGEFMYIPAAAAQHQRDGARDDSDAGSCSARHPDAAAEEPAEGGERQADFRGDGSVREAGRGERGCGGEGVDGVSPARHVCDDASGVGGRDGCQAAGAWGGVVEGCGCECIPLETFGNIQATVYAVAEKAADLIKGDGRKDQ